MSTIGQQIKNVVLVHGAFADGAGWRRVYDDLTARGYRVSIVQNPLTSLADDVAATTRVLDRQDGPTVLVGHSWGGTVITEAGDHPNVAGLVYVSALAPDVGRDDRAAVRGLRRHARFRHRRRRATATASSTPRSSRPASPRDASDADAAFLRDSQVPINMSVFGRRVTRAAWRRQAQLGRHRHR